MLQPCSERCACPGIVAPVLFQEEQRELANTIRVSGSILLSTVSNFLDFFKLEAVSESVHIINTPRLLSGLRAVLVLERAGGDMPCHSKGAPSCIGLGQLRYG